MQEDAVEGTDKVEATKGEEVEERKVVVEEGGQKEEKVKEKKM